MDNQPYTIFSLNESAALISFGNVVEKGINRKVLALNRLVNKNPFKGFVESLPAYSSLTVFYNPLEVTHDNSQFKSAFDFVKEHLNFFLTQPIPVEENEPSQVVEIPVLYDGEDLAFVTEQHQLLDAEVVTIHTSQTYRVFMIGFLPGFPYLGTLDERIATPRRSSPRIAVPAGSIGIAGFQTGIYPQPSPGGWQLIGRTPMKIFNKEKQKPCLLNPGDSVRFYSIDQQEFEKRNEY